MAFKTRLLATAAIPLMALAGYSLPASAMMIAPETAIQARSPIVAVQSEEEELPRQKRRNRQDAQEEMSDPANAEAEEPRRKNRKQREQAEEQQMQDAQPADNAQAEEEPRRKNRKQREQAEEQQMQDAEPADNAQAEEEPKRKNRKQREQAEEGVSDEDIVNQSKRRNQAEENDGQAERNAAETDEEPVRRKRKDRQQAEDGQQADDGNENAQSPDAVSDEDIVNKSKERNKKKRDRAEADTPEAIEKREEIARDPSKTTDTVVLPVENGAPVLDSEKDVDRGDAKVRERRKRQREEARDVSVPKSDKDAQKIDTKIVIKPVLETRGERIDDFRGYERPRGKRIGKGEDVRVVFDLDGRVVIRSNDRNRIVRDSRIRYERIGKGRIREVVVRPNGDRIVTVRNKWGEIIRRSRIDNRDREIVIFYSPALERGRERLYLTDPGDELPPMRLNIPVDDYIIDVSSEEDRNYEEFLAEPPVEQVERVYSVDEVKYSARIRDKVRRIDLDTINFETGSAEIEREEASSLREVATAIGDLLEKDPGETFLIEGHTDAVGSDESNLVLSDERAESVASVLTELFDIPAENLVTQGYGERFLKVETDDEERENRRVTIRRITPLVRPVEAAQAE